MTLLWRLIVGAGTVVGLATGLATVVGGLATNWPDAWRVSRYAGGMVLYAAVLVGAPAALIAYRRLARRRRRPRGWQLLVAVALVGFAVGLYPALVYILVDDVRIGSWDLFLDDMTTAGAAGLALAALGVPYFLAVGYRSQRAGRKQCPDCCEAVKAQARVCRHCGYRWASPPTDVVVSQ
jgi:hypothetical protein